MTKVVEILRHYSLNERLEYIEKGGEYPLNLLWCYDQIKKSGLLVECIEYNKTSLLNRIGYKIKIVNLHQQIECLKKSKETDFIWAPFIGDVFLLACLKLIGLYKKPILSLAEGSYVPHSRNIFKNSRQKIIRYILFNGIDSILFYSEKSYTASNQYKTLASGHGFLNSWGVDYEFFKSYIDLQKEPPKQNYIFTTGDTFRDFKTLIQAFKNIDFNLKITTRRDLDPEITKTASSNVIVDNSIKPGLHSVDLIRKEYFNSLAVAIPLHKSLKQKQGPIGGTVLYESFAMGKPVICTYNDYLPFNLEKEKVGLYVDFEDTKGWKQSVEYLINNPEEAREMGERAQYLVKNKYNYKLFSNEIINHINRLS